MMPCEVGGRFEYAPYIHRVATPWEIINILSAGGLGGGSINEFWGPPKSGKSTAAYQIAQEHLKRYGQYARVVIGDSENSDLLRLGTVFGLHPANVDRRHLVNPEAPDSRVFYYAVPLVEDAWSRFLTEIKRAADDNVYLLILWDSLTTSTPKDMMEKVLEFAKSVDGKSAAEKGELTVDDVGLYKAGMMYKARVVREMFNEIQGQMAWKPVVFLYVNQVTTRMGQYQSTLESGGGWGHKHAAHNSFCISQIGEGEGKSYDGQFAQRTWARLEVRASKMIPPTRRPVEFMIDNQQGGRIVPQYELVRAGIEHLLLAKAGSYWKVTPELARFIPAVEGGKRIQAGQQFYESMMARATPEFNSLRQGIRRALIARYRADYYMVDQAYQISEARLIEYRARTAASPAKDEPKAVGGKKIAPEGSSAPRKGKPARGPKGKGRKG